MLVCGDGTGAGAVQFGAPRTLVAVQVVMVHAACMLVLQVALAGQMVPAALADMCWVQLHRLLSCDRCTEDEHRGCVHVFESKSCKHCLAAVLIASRSLQRLGTVGQALPRRLAPARAGARASACMSVLQIIGSTQLAWTAHPRVPLQAAPSQVVYSL